MGKVDLTLPPTIGFADHFDGFRLSDGEIVNVRIMDTCGQERYDALFSNYYKDADCCLLVYDITSEKSFDKIKKYYIGKIKENCKNIIKVILLGNKADLKEGRKISKDDGAKLVEENGYIFMETSCKDNYNVSDAFATLIEMTNKDLLKRHKSKQFKVKNQNSKSEEVNEKKKCCS